VATTPGSVAELNKSGPSDLLVAPVCDLARGIAGGGALGSGNGGGTAGGGGDTIIIPGNMAPAWDALDLGPSGISVPAVFDFDGVRGGGTLGTPGSPRIGTGGTTSSCGTGMRRDSACGSDAVVEPTRLFWLAFERAVPLRFRVAVLGWRLRLPMTLRARLSRFSSCMPMSGEPTPPPSA
jgi:hypothetical protein